MEDIISGLLHYCHEGMLQGRWAFRLDVDKEYHCRNIFSRQMNLAYNTKIDSLTAIKGCLMKSFTIVATTLKL